MRSLRQICYKCKEGSRARERARSQVRVWEEVREEKIGAVYGRSTNDKLE